MRTATLQLRTGAKRRYCVVDDLSSLLWVANLSALELHPYLARHERPEYPVQVMLDLDPGTGAGMLDACRVALAARERLGERRLVPVVKTSGVSGLHVAVPLHDTSLSEARDFARALAAELANDDPVRVASPDARARQPGQVLVDWRQNDDRRSTAAPYSLRATVPLGVSMPVRWSEVETALTAGDAGLLRFSPADVLRRIESDGDLFDGPSQALAG
jgi:bifunctional non-homologous end joining protein LigD